MPLPLRRAHANATWFLSTDDRVAKEWMIRVRPLACTHTHSHMRTHTHMATHTHTHTHGFARTHTRPRTPILTRTHRPITRTHPTPAAPLRHASLAALTAGAARDRGADRRWARAARMARRRARGVRRRIAERVARRCRVYRCVPPPVVYAALTALSTLVLLVPLSTLLLLVPPRFSGTRCRGDALAAATSALSQARGRASQCLCLC